MALESYETFDAVKTRLDEIVDAVNAEDLPLDDALALYEEAVGLGLRASDLLETNIEAQRLEDEAPEDRADESSTSDDGEIEGASVVDEASGEPHDGISQYAEQEAAAPATA